jgi:hypothetical protein
MPTKTTGQGWGSPADKFRTTDIGKTISDLFIKQQGGGDEFSINKDYQLGGGVEQAPPQQDGIMGLLKRFGVVKQDKDGKPDILGSILGAAKGLLPGNMGKVAGIAEKAAGGNIVGAGLDGLATLAPGVGNIATKIGGFLGIG